MSFSETQSATDGVYDIPYSLSTPSASSDSSDEPLTPPRSPSRLDFCEEPYEEEDYKWYDGGNTIPLLWGAADDHGLSRPSRKSLHRKNTEGDEKCDDPVDFLTRVLASGPHSTPYEEPETQPPNPVDLLSDTAPGVPLTAIPLVGPLSAAEKMQRIRGKKPREPCHHGLSRNALILKKSLWDSRLSKWKELFSQPSTWQKPTTADCTSSLSPPTSIPRSGFERDMAPHASRWYAYHPQSPIFPRAGDILALRDQHAVELDQSFFEYPLWTIHKALYLFDMYDRLTRPFNGSNADETQMQPTSSKIPCSTRTPELAHADANPTEQTNTQSHALPPDTVVWNDFRPWERSWYQRWAVLENLVQRSSSGPSSPSIEAMEPSSVQSTWEDSDEDDDYDTLAANTMFSKRFVDEWD